MKHFTCPRDTFPAYTDMRGLKVNSLSCFAKKLARSFVSILSKIGRVYFLESSVLLSAGSEVKTPHIT